MSNYITTIDEVKAVLMATSRPDDRADDAFVDNTTAEDMAFGKIEKIEAALQSCDTQQIGYFAINLGAEVHDEAYALIMHYYGRTPDFTEEVITSSENGMSLVQDLHVNDSMVVGALLAVRPDVIE